MSIRVARCGPHGRASSRSSQAALPDAIRSYYTGLVAKNTTSVRLPDELVEALDRRAAARGLTRSQLIVEAVEHALQDGADWSPRFLKAISTPRPELNDAADAMMRAIRKRRSRKEAPDL